MARIFNIYFTYDDVLHSAIVSVRTTPFFTEYILGNLDEELKVQLPSTVIISQPDKPLFFQNNSLAHSEELISTIIKSVTAHIHADNGILSSE